MRTAGRVGAHTARRIGLTVAQRASLEEVAHRSACFELAFALDGQRLGPGALPAAGAVASAASPADVARRLPRIPDRRREVSFALNVELGFGVGAGRRRW